MKQEVKAFPYDKPKAVLFHKSVKSPQRPTHHHEYHQKH